MTIMNVEIEKSVAKRMAAEEGLSLTAFINKMEKELSVTGTMVNLPDGTVKHESRDVKIKVKVKLIGD